MKYTLEDLDRLRSEYVRLGGLHLDHEYVLALYECDHDVLQEHLGEVNLESED